MMSAPHKLIPLCLATAAALSGCGGSDGGGTGSLTLRVTDAPVDSATRVVVEFSGVELIKSDEGPRRTFTFEAPRQIDLLNLTEGKTETLLDGVSLEAGRYEQLRLLVNAGQSGSDSFIELEDGSLHPLFIPSGNQTGLKLVSGFIVPAGGSADFTIDFDLRKSVTYPQGLDGSYILKPALRLVDNAQVGAISGTVATALATAADCSPAVYVYQGTDVTPDDVGSATAPLTSALVKLDEQSGEYRYRAAFLSPGDYTAAFTCQAGADDPEADDDIAFEPAMNAAVSVDQDTRVDF
jgi:hypothetical protein